MALTAVVMCVSPVMGDTEKLQNTITGHIQILGTPWHTLFVEQNQCVGMGGFSDLSDGASVTVKDESGKVIGVSPLLVGTVDSANDSICRMPFSVKVPKTNFYTISIGRRGEITQSYQQLVGKSWKIEFSIGY